MDNETKRCPFCGEEIMKAAKKCKYCGEWLDYQDANEQNQVIHCAFCGKVVPSTAEKCPNCGEWLKDENKELSCGYCLSNYAVRLILYLSIFVGFLVFYFCLSERITEGIFFWPFFAFILCFVSLYIFFIPTICAVSRNHPQLLPIFLVNLFFGETVIGWVVCMIWATTHRHGRHTHW